MTSRLLALAAGTFLATHGALCWASDGAPPASTTGGQKSATDAPSGATASPNGTVGIQEITVTATRRAQSSERVPISMEVLGQAQLAEGGIKSINDIASVTPGLTFQLQGYASTLTLISFRGLESLFGASTVGVYVDDTPIQGRLSSDGNVGNPYPAVFDLNRVEVARGPQGTLFGSGSESGTVRFISNEPSLTTYSGLARAEVGATQSGGISNEFGVAVGGPIVKDKIGFRISAWERTNGGYLDRAQPWNGNIIARNTNWDRTASVRAALAFQLSEDTKFTPSVFYQDSVVANSSRFDPNFSNSGKDEFVSVTLLPEHTHDHFVLPSAKLESHLGFADLTAVASYFYRRADLTSDLSGFVGALGLATYGNPLGTTYAGSQTDASPLGTGTLVHAYTQEVRLASHNPGAFLSWVVGVYHDHRTQQDYQNQTSADIDPSGHEIFYTLQTVVDDQTALFGQADLHLSRQFTLVGGDRIAWTKVTQTNINGTGVLDATPSYASTQIKQTPNTPHVSLNFQADPHNLFYATYSKGFRVGGGNDPLPAVCGYSAVPQQYSSDNVTNFEIGAKDLLLDGRLKVDSSVFHILWNNIQQLAQPSCGISYTFNSGKAVSNGFDLALEALVTSQLKLDLSVAYADAHLTTNVFDSNGVILAQAGDKIGYLPYVNAPWNVNVTGNYTIPLRSDETLKLRLQYRYNSRNPGPFINQITASPNYAPQEHTDPATNMVNASIALTKGKADLTLAVNNLFNVHPLLDVYAQAVPEAPTYSTFRPRTVSLTLNYPF
jgi:outer membrane receptor protein involved in Fe transport